MDFQAAVELVLELEGGGRIVSHPKDPGGLTKYGISLRAHPELGADGIRNLTAKEAKEIYLREYWNPLKLDRFSPRLALPLFDAAVNHGIQAAGEILQESLNRLGADLEVDGILGEKTVKSTKNYSPKRVLSAFLVERLRFYRSLKTYDTFGSGWEKRIMDIALSA
ncbi:MAG TPA: glycosyl hydrolase 108 family protein [Oligoflexus sp.]|uniref:glycoside hydrolase family 108 protein n=1 Tax=Oligoflexus sp. TaxID=1971216 RepID=UPI002D36852C|nr:glycosyl hydrolase 108 family protein [Oligoflexus sp.]HYX35803.1 glycosyl hydrolase 108 family protein [Oligoflexus sp.]